MAFFNDGSRAFQDRFDTRRLADRIEEKLVRVRITDEDREFITARDMLFLATANAEGRPQCSYKGGAPGFVRVLDETTIAFPSYDGNGMYLSAGNISVNAHVGILFIDFEAQKRLRLNGIASQSDTDPLLAEFAGAQFIWRVRATEVFPNCPRYIHKYQLVERSHFVPKAEERPPVPAWKTREWSRDVLPEDDPARDPNAKIE
jgi:predicted pyridoxine 5'-phosphate oxidase superfamily flavin-nucleotide-binding protein